jgi:ribonuclease E
VNYLINQKREHVALIEARYGMSVRIEADPMLVSPDYSMEKLKTATRVVPETPVVSGHAGLMGAPVAEEEEDDLIEDPVEDEVEEAEAEGETTAAGGEGEGQPGRKKRRRRRRRRGGPREGEGGQVALPADEGGEAPEAAAEAEGDDAATPETPAEGAVEGPAAKSRRTRKPRGARAGVAVTEAAGAAVETVSEAVAAEVAAEAATDTDLASAPAEAEALKPRRAARKPKAAASEEAIPPAEDVPAPAKPTRTRASRAKVAEAAAPVLAPDPGLVPTAETLVADPAEPAAVAEDPGRPKRKGWWSLGR